MKQILQSLKSGETLVADVPIPAPKPGTALIKTAASLVSAGTERMVVSFAEKSLFGKIRSRPELVRQMIDKARREGVLTTLEAAFNRLDQPMTLGYSSAGTIIALGEGLYGFQVGDKVACAGGGYAVHAEYALVPQNLMVHVPDTVDFESAAFATLGAIALHGFRLAESQVGERVAIIGLGLVGLLAAGIASAAGCQVLGIDFDPRRVELANKMGVADAVVRSGAEAAARAISRGRGMDSVLICADATSTDPVNLAAIIARDRAHVVAVGAVDLHLPRKIYFEKELSFINSRSYGPGRYDPHYEENQQDYPVGYVRWTEGRNLEAIVDLLANRRLNVHPLISHRFPIEQAAQAYDLITGKLNQSFLGVLITYSQGQITLPISHSAHTTTENIVKPETVNLGVLGAGNFASVVMLPVLRKIPKVKPVYICSASGVSAYSAAKKYGFVSALDIDDQILSSADVNTVAILTRHNLHATQVIAALAEGKHVFCEKPLAIKEEELEKISEQIQKSGNESLLMVGFNRRFAPLAQRLKEFLGERREPVAAHYRVNAGYIPPTHWVHDPEQGGGRIIGEGCHFIDFLTYLVGQLPISVSCHFLPDEGRYRQDNVVITLTFQDGSLGTVTYLSNGDKAFPKERVEVFCGGSVAVLDDFRSLEMVRDGKRKVMRSFLRQDKGHRAEWEAFVKAITDTGIPPIPYEQIFAVTKASFTALRALQTGKEEKVA
jgi:predicted dehydrogenase